MNNLLQHISQGIVAAVSTGIVAVSSFFGYQQAPVIAEPTENVMIASSNTQESTDSEMQEVIGASPTLTPTIAPTPTQIIVEISVHGVKYTCNQSIEDKINGLLEREENASKALSEYRNKQNNRPQECKQSCDITENTVLVRTLPSENNKVACYTTCMKNSEYEKSMSNAVSSLNQIKSEFKKVIGENCSKVE